jgi:hypothetical protein
VKPHSPVHMLVVDCHCLVRIGLSISSFLPAADSPVLMPAVVSAAPRAKASLTSSDA